MTHWEHGPRGRFAVPTPFGDAAIDWEGGAITRLHLPGAVEGSGGASTPPAAVLALGSALAGSFSGAGPLPAVTDLGIRPELSTFHAAVVAVVANIPSGRTMTYAEVAAAAGRPGAARAVGAALAANRFAPVIPCHRVVGSDGSMRGYAGGRDMKRRLIEMERTGAG